ncbi:hypothetical protein [uncultured Xylophilus sp.]|uniref:hypothetical protein n=1 Tax=uncultured Xylophilus sp. TaxID=296832 RepID=UPI0025EDDE57|nr:hypothetical protein [uncultured Xylophilus sp.]
MEAAVDRHPTLLTNPHIRVVGLSDCGLDRETHILDLPAAEYVIHQNGAHWQVRRKDTLALVYSGPGPVDVTTSPAPF